MVILVLPVLVRFSGHDVDVGYHAPARPAAGNLGGAEGLFAVHIGLSVEGRTGKKQQKPAGQWRKGNLPKTPCKSCLLVSLDPEVLIFLNITTIFNVSTS